MNNNENKNDFIDFAQFGFFLILLKEIKLQEFRSLNMNYMIA